jgi:hypothetical protein
MDENAGSNLPDDNENQNLGDETLIYGSGNKVSACMHTKYEGCPPCPCEITIIISREDAEAIIAGPKLGKRFRDASARELDAIRAALKEKQ